ncbi:hypothetical protein LCGC14_1441420 [marine sediment metagenome]|uniref:Uncharacterized protein n=1 Tax=marine sediment metagenome TaxID=412755 RepID=A0A0F9M162_9ZZZZ
MTDTAPLTTERPVLHPRQVADLRQLKAEREAQLSAPPHIRNQIQDVGAIVKEIRDIDGTLDKQAPRPISADQMDEAVKLEATLRESWLKGMPTQAEMRRNPPGAVDKHRKWEKLTKSNVLLWKGLRRRLHASGVSDYGLNDESDVSNVEKFRPRGGGGELNLNPAQIEGKIIELPPVGAGQAVVFNDADIERLTKIDPEIAASLGTLPNDTRRRILDLLHGDTTTDTTEEPKPSKRAKGKGWTPERRRAQSERMKTRHAKQAGDPRTVGESYVED